VFPEDTDASGLDGANDQVKIRNSVGTWAGTANDWTNVTDANLAVATDKVTVTINLADLTNDIKEGAWIEIETITTKVRNPSAIGDYTLTVATSVDTTKVESPAYTTTAPVVGGFVYVYNPSNILLATYGGSSALNDADTGGYFDQEGYTIKVGPGTYTLTGDISITGKGVTLESSEDAAATIIKAAGFALQINTGGEDVVIDGFTIDDADYGVDIDEDDATVKDCVITDATEAGVRIQDGGTDATISDNVIEDCDTGILFAAQSPAVDLGDVDITGNTITEANTLGAIAFGGGNEDVDITGNTITDNEVSGICFVDEDVNDVACDDILIEGNTISANEEHGIEIAENDVAPTKLVIRENDIIDNEKDGMNILGWDADTDVVMFNNFSGNTSDNIETTVAVTNAVFNWWGSAVEDDITAELSGAGTVTYDPWLADTQEAVVSGSKVAVGADTVTSIDAKSVAGVKVSGMEDDDGDGAYIISAAKYEANPEGAIDDAIGFYDVYVALDDTVCDPAEVSAKLKFYSTAITGTSTVSFWTGDFWAECSDITARDGLVWVTVTEDTTPTLDELKGTPFVVVAGPEEAGIAAPALVDPAKGEEDVSLSPSFSWDTVAGATGYSFELADNPLFVLPIVSLTDGGGLTVPFYKYVGELDYSTVYYWRVKALDINWTDFSVSNSSDWEAGVFTTEAEVIPEEPEAPVWTCPVCGLTFDSRDALAEHAASAHPPEEPPVITIESPDVVVPLPAETPITPAWIYAIIAVGAVLVISVIVLIVRTRRVA